MLAFESKSFVSSIREDGELSELRQQWRQEELQRDYLDTKLQVLNEKLQMKASLISLLDRIFKNSSKMLTFLNEAEASLKSSEDQKQEKAVINEQVQVLKTRLKSLKSSLLDDEIKFEEEFNDAQFRIAIEEIDSEGLLSPRMFDKLEDKVVVEEFKQIWKNMVALYEEGWKGDQDRIKAVAGYLEHFKRHWFQIKDDVGGCDALKMVLQNFKCLESDAKIQRSLVLVKKERIFLKTFQNWSRERKDDEIEALFKRSEGLQKAWNDDKWSLALGALSTFKDTFLSLFKAFKFSHYQLEVASGGNISVEPADNVNVGPDLFMDYARRASDLQAQSSLVEESRKLFANGPKSMLSRYHGYVVEFMERIEAGNWMGASFSVYGDALLALI